MTGKLLAAATLALTLGACAGPPPPKMVDAFKDVYNGLFNTEHFSAYLDTHARLMRASGYR